MARRTVVDAKIRSKGGTTKTTSLLFGNASLSCSSSTTATVETLLSVKSPVLGSNCIPISAPAFSASICNNAFNK